LHACAVARAVIRADASLRDAFGVPGVVVGTRVARARIARKVVGRVRCSLEQLAAVERAIAIGDAVTVPSRH
jgi:hypothetical protein